MQKVAEKTYAENRYGDNENDPANCTVSLDGSWQTRGFSSLNGVVTGMSGRKCIDYDILTKTCRACAICEGKDKTSEKYLEWQANHSCLINHTGSSSSMESCGALNIFHRSVERYNLRYEYYLGDGDSSSFQSVEDAKP